MNFHKVPKKNSRLGAGKGKTVRLRGKVTTGSKEAVFFTELPWVKKQFVDKLGIEAYPGTFNITVLPEDQEKLNRIKKARGVEIVPPDASFCAGKGFSALVDSKVQGAAIIPLVPNYPEPQLEVICARNIRQTLFLKDGDLVEVEVYL